MTPLDGDKDHLHSHHVDRAWIHQAIATLKADARRSADTHLVKVPMPTQWAVDVYVKDESTHRTGSLKHRLARSLFLYGLCNGWIGPGTTIIEASSGSTAVSEAFFARQLGLPFIAVMSANTSHEKIKLIESEGGKCHLVEDPTTIYSEAAGLAEQMGGHYLDQFTYAERATDWRGNNNIAESIFDQMSQEPHPVPRWIVVGAGTGGTSATIGRFVRYQQFSTKLCVVDPEGSAFLPAFTGVPETDLGPCGSRIEGIGRPRVEPSFILPVVERMIGVPDAASIAAARFLRDDLGMCVGPSTGTNWYGTLKLACEMRAQGDAGSLVTVMCDNGNRYQDTYENDDWVASQGWQISQTYQMLQHAFATGEWLCPSAGATSPPAAAPE